MRFFASVICLMRSSRTSTSAASRAAAHHEPIPGAFERLYMENERRGIQQPGRREGVGYSAIVTLPPRLQLGDRLRAALFRCLVIYLVQRARTGSSDMPTRESSVAAPSE